MHGGEFMIQLCIASFLICSCHTGRSLLPGGEVQPPKLFLRNCARAASLGDYSWVNELNNRLVQLLPAAEKEINSKDPELRLVCVSVIGRVGLDKSWRLFDKLAIKDPFHRVRHESIGYLRAWYLHWGGRKRLRGAKQLIMQEAIETFAKATTDPDRSVVTIAAMSLGEMGGPVALNRLSTMLRTGSVDSQIDAAAGLGATRDPKAVPPLQEALKGLGHTNETTLRGTLETAIEQITQIRRDE